MSTKSVRFCPCTAKAHDGLQPRHEALQRLITSFLLCQTEFTEFAVFDAIHFDAKASVLLLEDMQDLVHRLRKQQRAVINESSKQRGFVQLLPRGGGLALRISIHEHQEYMERLCIVVKSASDRLCSGEDLFQPRQICRDVETGHVFELQAKRQRVVVIPCKQ